VADLADPLADLLADPLAVHLLDHLVVMDLAVVADFDLAVGQGCFPFDDGPYPPLPDSRDTYDRYSEFIWVWYRCDGPSSISALPPAYN